MFLTFIKKAESPSGLTEIYTIQGKSPGILGEIKWFSNWRRYCFYPNAGSIWDASCLQEVEVFIRKLMEARK